MKPNYIEVRKDITGASETLTALIEGQVVTSDNFIYPFINKVEMDQGVLLYPFIDVVAETDTSFVVGGLTLNKQNSFSVFSLSNETIEDANPKVGIKEALATSASIQIRKKIEKDLVTDIIADGALAFSAGVDWTGIKSAISDIGPSIFTIQGTIYVVVSLDRYLKLVGDPTFADAKTMLGQKIVVNSCEALDDSTMIVFHEHGVCGGFLAKPLEVKATPAVDGTDVISAYSYAAGWSTKYARVITSDGSETYAAETSGQSLSVKTTDDTGELPNWAAWIADTSTTAVTRAMPSNPVDGEEITVYDVNENASTNNITLTVTGPTTISDATIDVDGGAKRWRYDEGDDSWDVVFSQAPSTGGGVIEADKEAYIVATAYSEYDTATTQTVNIPTEAEAGDILVLTGFLRTAYTQPAAGWTEICNEVETGTGEVDQRLVVLWQVYNGTDTDVTFGGASGTRMGFCVSVVRNSDGNGPVDVSVNNNPEYRSVTALEYTMPALTNSESVPRLGMQAMTWSYTTNTDDADESTSTHVLTPALQLSNPFNNPAGAAFSQSRLLALAVTVPGSSSHVQELPQCSIDVRSPTNEPTVPHCTFWFNSSADLAPAYPDFRIRFEMDTSGESPGSQNVTDASGYSVPVTVTGNTNIQADGSVYFDGDGDYMSIPDSDQYSVADSSEVEFEVEINWDGDGDTQQSLVNGRDTGSAEEFRLVIDGGNVTLQTFITGSLDAEVVMATTLTSGVWYNIKATRVSGEWTLRVNDSIEGTATESGTPTGNAGELFFGHSAFNASRQFKGYMRKIKITKQF